MKSNILNTLQIIFILVNIFLITVNSNAKTYQHQQIIKIYSTSQITNILNNSIIFQGKVKLLYKNIYIHADKIYVYNTKNQRNLPIIKAYGNPVILHQSQTLKNNIVSAQSSMIQYDVNKNIIHLIGNACIRQSENSIHSDKITYIIKDKKIKASSNQGKQVITEFLIQN